MEHETYIRYLSRADIEKLSLSGNELAVSIARTLSAEAKGQAQNFPKTSKIFSDGRLFQSLMAVGLEAPAPLFAATKIIGLSPGNPARGLPIIGGLIVLTSGETGMPIAIMDATWITEMRTAALSLVVAKRFARADSRKIAFIGCGAQARAHLRVFAEAFPLSRVTALSRSRSSAEALASKAQQIGLQAEVADDPRHAVVGADIVITSVPDGPDLKPFLRAEWLSPGAFASLVDLGRCWQPDGFESIEHRLVDDRAQVEASRGYRKLTPDGPYTADLRELMANPGLRRRAENERAVFTFQGVAVADLAVGALVFEAAQKTGIGVLLPR